MRLERTGDIEKDISDDDDDFLSKEQDNNFDNEDFNLGGYDDVGGLNATPIERHQELYKQLMDFKPYLREKFQQWVGAKWDEEAKKFVKNESARQIMNEKGAMYFISYITTYARENNILTYIGQQEYRNLQLDILQTVISSLVEHAEEFEIKTQADNRRVVDEVMHTSMLVLMGAGEGKYSKLLTESTQRHENVNYGNPYEQAQRPQMPKRGGLWSGMKRMFGG